MTSAEGMTEEREEQLPGLFPDKTVERCHVFKDRKVKSYYVRYTVPLFVTFDSGPSNLEYFIHYCLFLVSPFSFFHSLSIGVDISPCFCLCSLSLFFHSLAKFS